MWKWTALMVRGPLTPYTNSPTCTHTRKPQRLPLLTIVLLYYCTSNHYWFYLIFCLILTFCNTEAIMRELAYNKTWQVITKQTNKTFSHTHLNNIRVLVRVKRSRPGARLLGTHKGHNRTRGLACLGWCVRVEAAGVSFCQHFHNTSLWSGSRACRAHTHISEVVMCVSNTNYTVSMLANKRRRTTFATSFITIIYLLDLCYNLSDLTLMFMIINDQIKGDWL